MASGETHARITAFLAAPAGVAGVLVTQSPVIGICVAIGVLSGLYIEPDLDIATLTRSERKLIKAYGWWGRLWSTYWYFYGLSFRHRSKWTHKPFIGTLGRVVYLTWLPLLLGLMFWPDITVSFIGSQYFVSYFIGLSIADIGHWLADGMP